MRRVLKNVGGGLLIEAETQRHEKQRERQAKEREFAARIAAEARIAELEAENRALKLERDRSIASNQSRLLKPTVLVEPTETSGSRGGRKSLETLTAKAKKNGASFSFEKLDPGFV